MAAHAAGLAGIGVEADRSLVLDFAGVVAQADRLGLFVVGLPRDTEHEQRAAAENRASSPAKSPGTCSAPISSLR